eukprot:g6255.t1
MKKFIVASLAATGVATQPIVTCMEQHCMSEGIACLNDAGCKQAIQCAEKCPTSGPDEKSCVMKCYGSSPDKAETDLLKCAEQSKCIPSLHDPVRVSMYKTTVVTFDASSHYEDPKNGCQNGEVDIQIQGVAGKMCAPSCGLFRKCPTDVPTGVTAKPQCALQASTESLEEVMGCEFIGDSDDFVDADDFDEDEGKVEDAKDIATEEPAPDHFSKVNVHLKSAKLKKQFPKFYKAQSERETFVTLHENEMLFLPAGWFHEVSSLSRSDEKCRDDFSCEAEDSVTGVANVGKCGHFAMNFWFHPPTETNFDTPYGEDSFWHRDWEHRIHVPK